ncbi:MAG: hypothetical protein ABFR95_08605 [Actinomycetota bacterium]
MRWLPAMGGTFATAAELVSLGYLASEPAPSDPAPQVQSIVEEDVEGSESQLSALSAGNLPAPVKPSVSDVDSSISDALAGTGYTESIAVTQLSQSLPADIVGLLVANEAVLATPSEEME